MAPLSMIKKGYLLYKCTYMHATANKNMICKLSLTTDPVGGVASADDNKTGNGHFFIFRVFSVQYINDESVLQLPRISNLRVPSCLKCGENILQLYTVKYKKYCTMYSVHRTSYQALMSIYYCVGTRFFSVQHFRFLQIYGA
jgi:hypothetical protein